MKDSLLLLLGLFMFVSGCLWVLSDLDKETACTVTIKDMQGVKHVIRGVADNE